MAEIRTATGEIKPLGPTISVPIYKQQPIYKETFDEAGFNKFVEQKPKIQFKNLSEIYRERENKKKQKEKLLGALSVFHGAKSEEADFFRQKFAKNKENEIPHQVEGLMSTLDTKESKSLTNLRKTFSVNKKSSLEDLKKISKNKNTDNKTNVLNTKKNSKKISSDQKALIFDKLKRIR